MASRLGFHYFPDDRHYSPADLAAWLPVLRSFGAAWLVVRGTAARAIPEPFLRGLMDEGIEPIVHLGAPIGAVAASEIEPLLRAYASWGVRQVVLHDRPNLRASWEASEWSRVGLIERFLDRLLPVWNLEIELGLVPTFPPLEPGGDYWDTAFLEGALRGLARRGQESLLDRLAIGAYAWTFGRPLDWGAGGPRAWPESRPYHTPEGSQDQRGLRLPEWYAAISQDAVGRGLPLYVLGGGALPPRAGDDSAAAFEQNAGVARWLMGDDAPATLRAFAFYVLTADSNDAEAYAAWFAAPDRPRHDVDVVRGALLAATKSRRPKSLAHYILLPHASADPVFWSWAGQLAARSSAAVGFSPDEARLAARVTLLGQADARVVADLEHAGCRVERVDSESPAAVGA